MANKRAVKSKKSTRPKDLGLGTRRSRSVKGGQSATRSKPDVLKTPSPTGPVPIPYPN